MLSQQGAPGCGCAIFALCVLQGGELVLPRHLEHSQVSSEDKEQLKEQGEPPAWTPRVAVLSQAAGDLPGEGEDIKDKLLHLYAVGFAGVDPIATGVHERHLFNCHMWFQPLLELPVRSEREQKLKGTSTTAGQDSSGGESAGSYSATSSRKLLVKKWLQMFPALKTRSPPGPRSSASSGGISLYSTTWETP